MAKLMSGGWTLGPVAGCIVLAWLVIGLVPLDARANEDAPVVATVKAVEKATEAASVVLPGEPVTEPAPVLCEIEPMARVLLAEGECPRTCEAPYGPSCNDRWDCEEYCSDPGPQGGIPFCSTCGCCICA